MVGTESTYATPVTPARGLEYVSEQIKFMPNRVQGQGLFASSRFARSGRRVTTTKQAGGPLQFELLSKGQGLMWKYLMGVSTHTLVSGSTYQQLHTLGTSSDVLTPFTLQKGLPRFDVSAIDPYTFAGCVIPSWELTIDNAGIAMINADVDARSMATATALAAPSYAASAGLLHFGQVSAATLGGTVTAPTSTALGSGGTSVANLRSLSMKVDRKPTVDGFNFAAGGLKRQPVEGTPIGTGKMTIEYTDTVVRDAFIADTELAFSVTLTTETALSTGFEQFQLVLPAIKFDSDTPVTNGGQPILIDAEFTILDNRVAAAPIYVVQRTSDTAL